MPRDNVGQFERLIQKVHNGEFLLLPSQYCHKHELVVGAATWIGSDVCIIHDIFRGNFLGLRDAETGITRGTTFRLLQKPNGLVTIARLDRIWDTSRIGGTMADHTSPYVLLQQINKLLAGKYSPDRWRAEVAVLHRFQPLPTPTPKKRIQKRVKDPYGSIRKLLPSKEDIAAKPSRPSPSPSVGQPSPSSPSSSIAEVLEAVAIAKPAHQPLPTVEELWREKEIEPYPVERQDPIANYQETPSFHNMLTPLETAARAEMRTEEEEVPVRPDPQESTPVPDDESGDVDIMTLDDFHFPYLLLPSDI